MPARGGSAEDPGSGSVFTGKKGYPDLLVAAALDAGTELYSDKFMVRMIRKDRFTCETLPAVRREVFNKELAGRNLRYIRSGCLAVGKGRLGLALAPVTDKESECKQN